MCGPTGIGVLWGRRELLEEMPPFLGGGEMIETVWMDRLDVRRRRRTSSRRARCRSREAVGLGAAVDYLSDDRAWRPSTAHEQRPDRRTRSTRWPRSTGCASSGRPSRRTAGAAISFTVDGVHPHDVSQVLDERGIAVRAGHHCAWPLHRALGVQASTRASFYLYNTHEEVDALVDGIRQAQRFFGVLDR